MTALRCPADHAVLVPMDADPREWRCPLHGWMDTDEAARIQREAAHVNDGIGKADLLPEVICQECRRTIEGRIYVDGRDVPYCLTCWNELHYDRREAAGL